MAARAAGFDQQISPEHQLKAVYLYNFLSFVYWPAKKCGSEPESLRDVVVVGDSQLEDALKALQVKLENTGKPPLSIVFLGPYYDGMDLSGCHLLFISTSEYANFDRIVANVEGEAVLTVTDDEKFVELGGMITLVSRQNKVRWTINRRLVRQAGLRVNSKLLDIAVKVIE